MPPRSAAHPSRRPFRRTDDVEALFAPQRTPSEELPDPAPLVAALTRGILEVLAGTREVDQLARWLAEEPYLKLMTRANLSRRARSARRIPAQRPVFSVRTMRRMTPADGVAEVVVIVSMPDRTRALAMRLEGLDGRWRATDLRIL
ncbi:Rv3235 family protein [Microbacterium betulae]|uniref:Rv3235 family protein n=1 Tax=Microbacterium betulae TaxID=2981139 RepID=A0AA97FIK1_9MICO|nr:Rv3235 family protein [Microbacterium sp. AB]WOF24216.1 Rv3235 family protein [Microbacterium sp. AB]